MSRWLFFERSVCQTADSFLNLGTLVHFRHNHLAGHFKCLRCSHFMMSSELTEAYPLYRICE